jgi:histidinol-phosphate aminotransferase
MQLPRRQFFRQMATGIAAGAVLPVIGKSAWSGNWRAMQAGTAGSQIHLDANENPYGPSRSALDALRGDAPQANRYAKHEYAELADAIAAKHGVKAERVVLGCGSSENLAMAAPVFLGPGKTLFVASPTFELIVSEAEDTKTQVISLPLTSTHAHDLEGVLARTTPSGSGVVYICNPNNPTGTLTPRADLDTFLTKLPAGYTVIVDEAYHHFVGATPAYTSFLDKPVDDERVIVLRTFSKIYGMAGIRCGYSVAAPAVAKKMAAQQMKWGMSVLTARAALAAWNDADSVRMGAARNAADRAEFFAQIKKRGLTAIPSETNFAMIRAGRPAPEVIAHFKKNSVLIGRPFPPLTDYVRVSLGLPAEMQEFWRVWDAMAA